MGAWQDKEDPHCYGLEVNDRDVPALYQRQMLELCVLHEVSECWQKVLQSKFVSLMQHLMLPHILAFDVVIASQWRCWLHIASPPPLASNGVCSGMVFPMEHHTTCCHSHINLALVDCLYFSKLSVWHVIVEGVKVRNSNDCHLARAIQKRS